ncbi:unnamed protein product [Sympodiomycopsis kandeliae]
MSKLPEISGTRRGWHYRNRLRPHLAHWQDCCGKKNKIVAAVEGLYQLLNNFLSSSSTRCCQLAFQDAIK